jgi:nucleoside-diphosphate-sugar epimerase
MRTVVVTGAGGFLGKLLVEKLSKDESIETILALDMKEPLESLGNLPKTKKKVVDITDELQVKKAIEGYQVHGVVHLAAIMSGLSEADITSAMKINMIGAINVMLSVANEATNPRFVFSSSIAAFGNVAHKATYNPDINGGAPDDRQPASTYGSTKAAVELLLANYSRKKLIDGISLRIPIVAVRPGIPSGAASTFVSDLVREPLQGNNVQCPVEPEQSVVVISPRKTIEALYKALLHMNTSQLGPSRVLVVPGISAQAKDYVESLRKIAGEETAKRVSYRKDPKIYDIISTWPSKMDSKLARKLGLSPDDSSDDIVRQFIEDYMPGANI